MYNIFNTSLFIFLFVLFTNLSFAQEKDTSVIEYNIEYTDLKEVIKYPQKVVKLDLSRCKLKEFPKEILKCTNLQELNLSNNRITEIPAEIAVLKNLKVLKISRNKLTSLPHSIGKLTNLKVLVVFSNQLTTFPAEIGNLNRLEIIDAWGNEIGYLPKEIANLKNLQILDLRVINFNDQEKSDMEEMLPKTKIIFSDGCNCGR